MEENIISPLRKKIGREFDSQFKTSGRSGGHGKKFNILSKYLVNLSNNVKELDLSECVDSVEERKFIATELKKKATQFQKKANGINHLYFRK